MSTILNGDSDLYALADGTLITWLRIPSDPTSHAIAFVNIEHTDDPDAPEPTVLWISPGGWMPMTPTGADVTYPCVALGTLQEIVDGQHQLDVLINDVQPYTLPEVHTLDVGGSWPSLRVEALKAAATVWTTSIDRRFLPSDVLDTAGDFLKWLSNDPLDEALASLRNPFDSVESEPERQSDVSVWDVAVSQAMNDLGSALRNGSALRIQEQAGMLLDAISAARQAAADVQEQIVTARTTSDRAWFDDGRTRTLFHVLREALSGDDAARAVTNALGVLDHWTAVTPPADGQ